MIDWVMILAYVTLNPVAWFFVITTRHNEALQQKERAQPLPSLLTPFSTPWRVSFVKLLQDIFLAVFLMLFWIGIHALWLWLFGQGFSMAKFTTPPSTTLFIVPWCFSLYLMLFHYLLPARAQIMVNLHQFIMIMGWVISMYIQFVNYLYWLAH